MTTTRLNLTTVEEIHFLPGNRLELVMGSHHFILGADLLRAIKADPMDRAD